MITLLEFKQFVESFIQNTDKINIDTFDKYLDDYNFADLFHDCNVNKIKGDIFEYITKYYYLSRKLAVYLFDEVPISLRDKLKLGQKDKGIDLIYKFQDDWVGVQCKWRSNVNNCIDKDLVSGFIEELKRTTLNYGYMFTNVNNLTKYHLESNLKWITRPTLEKNINKEFINYIIDEKSNIILPNDIEKPIEQLRYYQQETVNKLSESYNPNKKCIMACGTGKSVIMIEYIKRENSNRIVVLLPSLQLISQLYKKLSVNLSDREILCVCSQMDKTTLTYGEANEKQEQDILNEFLALDQTIYTTDIKIIDKKLDLTRLIVLCTYQSSKLLKYASFDLGLFDEAHKTVNNYTFGYLLENKNCVINERIYFTATPRYYKGKDEKCVSMDNNKIYGNTCYEYSFKKAIAEKHILDFQIVAYSVPDNMSDIVTEKYIKKDNLNLNSEILISAVMLVQHIKNDSNCSKILTYHNSVSNATNFKKTLNYILDKLNVKANVYMMSGKTSMSMRNKIFDEFKSSEVAIICSARVLNEGVDMPCVNAVMFVDPRSSTIDVTQCVGRGMRLYKDQKHCNIIIPIHYDHLVGRHNYSEIIRILTAMSEIDDKLIEYYVMKNISNKIMIKNMIVTDICNVNEVKYDLDDLMENVKTEILKSRWLGFEYNKALLFKYCDEYKRTPAQGTIYSNQYIAVWMSNNKKKLKSIDDEIYKKLSQNEYVKIKLDNYLLNHEKNKDKIKLNWNEMCQILFAYCNEYKCPPMQTTIYRNQHVGTWMIYNRNKITSIENELYKKLSINEYIKITLDEYLFNLQNKIKLDWTESCEILFEYCNSHKCMPVLNMIYKNLHLLRWYDSQKNKINSINDELYKKLSINKYVKYRLDKYLLYLENKDKIWEQWCKLLFKYCDEYKCIPQRKVVFGGKNLGAWFHSVKSNLVDNEDDVYKILSTNEYVKESLDYFLNPNKKWNEWYDLLLEYCNENKCVPQAKTVFKQKGLGYWYHDLKKDLNSLEDDVYVKFSTNEYIKADFDKYLNSDKIKNELYDLLFEYCNENRYTPSVNVVYKNKSLGAFYSYQKQKLNSSEDELYKKLSVNEYIKANLDKYLSDIEKNKDKIKFTFDELCKLLFEYCDENKCTPKAVTSYKQVCLGSWMQYTKTKINSSDDEIYKKLSVNEYVKENLNKYLLRKNQEKNQPSNE